MQLALSSGQWQGRLGGSCHRHLPALPRRDGLSDSIQRTSASSKMNSQQPRGPTGHHPSAQGKRPGFTPQSYWRPVGPRSGLASFHAQPLSRTLGAQDSNEPRVTAFARQTDSKHKTHKPPPRSGLVQRNGADEASAIATTSQHLLLLEIFAFCGSGFQLLVGNICIDSL